MLFSLISSVLAVKPPVAVLLNTEHLSEGLPPGWPESRFSQRRIRRSCFPFEATKLLRKRPKYAFREPLSPEGPLRGYPDADDSHEMRRQTDRYVRSIPYSPKVSAAPSS
jgi:hypothetical protein